MGRKVGQLVYVVVFVLAGWFQHATAQSAKEADSDVFGTVLFSVTSPENDKVSYLFGTHHAFGKSFFDTLTAANEALERSELLIVENLKIPGETAQDIINQRATVTEWKKYLSKEDLSFIKALFAISPTDYKKMTPTELTVFLQRHFKQQVCLQKSTKDSSHSLDEYIASKACEQGIELLGLETTKEQIELINKDVEGMPRKIHKRRLSNIIDQIKTENRGHCEETEWYSEMGMSYELNAPCGNALILTNRNEKWMDAIADQLEAKNCFVAVGLSHLMFECGLINQLKDRGYVVTPLVLDTSSGGGHSN